MPNDSKRRKADGQKSAMWAILIALAQARLDRFYNNEHEQEPHCGWQFVFRIRQIAYTHPVLTG